MQYPITIQIRYMMWRSNTCPPANFVVAARGLCTQEQSINRAELAAMEQACQLAAQFNGQAEVWADSSYAVQVAVARQSGVAKQRRHRDLCPCPGPGVQVCKVKSHQDPGQVSDGLLHACLGNMAADMAARAAAAQELSLVVDESEAVAQWHAEQKAHFLQYCQFLLDLARAIAPTRRQIRQGEADARPQVQSQELRHSRWLALNQPGQYCNGLPQRIEDKLIELVWPPYFTKALLTWAAGLGWPTAQAPEDPSRGVTYLELLLNFSVTSGVCVPVLSRSHQRGGAYIDPATGSGILLPLVTRELLITFTAALKALSRHFDQPMLQGRAVKNIRTLSSWPGEPPYRKGRLVRPTLREAQATVEMVQTFCDRRTADVLREYCLRTATRARTFRLPEKVYGPWAILNFTVSIIENKQPSLCR